MQWTDAQSEFSIVITNLILAEVSNFLQRKAAPEIGRNFVDSIINDEKNELYYDSDTYLGETLEIYNRIKQLGYVDASIVLFYKLLKCRYIISFDSNFDVIKGLTRLDNIPA